MSSVQLTIDGRTIAASPGSNLLEQSIQNGIDIPHLCYDPRLKPFGACRLCFVEVKGRPQPVPACSLTVQAGMVVETNTAAVRDLRKTALELLLAEHCGDCLAPCRLACPAEVDIQGYVSNLSNGRYAEAAAVLRQNMPLPSICGRVCPRFCEKQCRRSLLDDPVDICGLKRWTGDFWLEHLADSGPAPAQDTGKRAAVVGGGPAGLTAAYYLAVSGHRVTLYDSGPELGGMLRYGIPEYRLPKDILDKEIQVITDLCEEVIMGGRLGSDYTLAELKNSYDAVFLGIGCQTPQMLPVENSELPAIYSGIGFLRDVIMGEPVPIGRRVAVIGGGNTAMDAARTAVRLGAEEVTVVYRRAREQMPAEPIEVEEAMEEGVHFHFLTNPSRFVGTERVEALECVRMELGEPDSSGRRRPITVPGSEHLLPVDSVIVAIGQKTDPQLVETLGLGTTDWGTLCACPDTQCSTEPGVFAAGDCVSGAATVVEAVGLARKAAMHMDRYLAGSSEKVREAFYVSRGELKELDADALEGARPLTRQASQHAAAEERRGSFAEYNQGLSEDQTREESSRCLSCGCLDYHSCELRLLAEEYNVDPSLFGISEKRYSVNDSHPYILHDPDKCILCGKCVQICQEVAGESALGFVHRGYETVIKPALDLPLADVCDSCGLCVSTCPSGALTLDLPWVSQRGPWMSDDVVQTTCLQCDVGCALEIRANAGTVVSALPPLRPETSQRGACEKGCFGYGSVYAAERLTAPLVRREGSRQTASWEDAVTKAVTMLRASQGEEGLSGLLVVLSPKLTNEVHDSVLKLAETQWENVQIVSTMDFYPDILPLDWKTLETSDFVLTVGDGISESYPTAHRRLQWRKQHGGRQLDVPDWKAVEPAVRESADQAMSAAVQPLIVLDGESVDGTTVAEIRSLWPEVRVAALYSGGNTQGQIQRRIAPWSCAHDSQAETVLLVGDERDAAELPRSVKRVIAVRSQPVDSECAEVVLPLAHPVEESGTVITSEGNVQSVRPVKQPPSGWSNLTILQALLAPSGEQNAEVRAQVAK